MAGGAFDIKNQFAFYGSYHNNTINKLVHIVFVPAILWAFAMLLARTGPILGVDLSKVHPLMEFNGAFIALAIYAVYYIILDTFAGVLMSAILFAFWLSATHVAHTDENWLTIFIVLQVASWTFQILSHKIFEGRSPALLDNLGQAFILAPLFVFLEVLFTLGYKPKLHEEIQTVINKEIQVWKNSQSRKAK